MAIRTMTAQKQTATALGIAVVQVAWPTAIDNDTNPA
jgi:hypothetical protein